MVTKLIDRRIPEYNRGEEVFSMILSIVGAVLSLAVLVFCLTVAIKSRNGYAIVTSSIYGASLIILYVFSSIYHGLQSYIPKKVFQILNHCAIFLLIAGTYTVILLSSIREVNPVTAWVLFGIEWAVAAFAITFISVDLEKNKILSIVSYIFMGWSILPIYKIAVEAISIEGVVLFLTGVVLYTLALMAYLLEKKVKHLHFVYHILFLLATAVQFFSIILYCI